jgi:hypothetical protein
VGQVFSGGEKLDGMGSSLVVTLAPQCRQTRLRSTQLTLSVVDITLKSRQPQPLHAMPLPENPSACSVFSVAG